MSKSLLHKVLIAGLVIIWSLVGYKFINGNKQAPDLSQVAQDNTALQRDVKKDSFTLKPVTRDPFLNTITTRKQTVVTQNKPTGGPVTSSKNTETIWPIIEYFGFVQNNNQPTPLALVKINNTLKRIREGGSFQSIYLTKVYSDSIQVQFGGENRVIIK